MNLRRLYLNTNRNKHTKKNLMMKGFVRPWEAYATLVSSSLVMLFVTCVIGAFFFPWSDTMLRVRMPMKRVIDGIITQGNPIEFDLVSECVHA